jgi:copper transport protein
MRIGARIGLIAVAVALTAPASASAHALLVGADPQDGARLDSAPTQIRLSFTEEISPEFRSVRLIAPDGRPVAGTRLSGEGSALVLEVPRLRKGTYAVDWRVVAEDDGHTTSGTITFGLGVAAATHGDAAREVTPSPVEVVLRWLRFSALALVLGAVALTSFVLGAAGRVPAARVARQRLLTAAALAAGLAVAAGVASAVREASVLSSSAGLGFPGLTFVRDLLFSSHWGHLWLLEELSFVILLVISLDAQKAGSRGPVYAGLAAVWIAVVAVCEGLGSHAAAISDAAVAVDAIHVLSAALWLGAVAALGVALWPTGAIGREGARAIAVACRWPFALLAGTGAVLAGVSGLYAAGREVASIDALLTTFYGRALLAKTAAVALAASLAASNAVLLTRVSRGRRRSIVTSLIVAEALVGIGVFLGAGVLTASSPARGPQFDAPRPVRAPTLAANDRDVLISATVRPNRPGENVVAVQVASTRRPAPAPILSVTARIGESPRPIALRPLEPGRYIANVTLPRSGPAGMSIVAHRAGQALTARLRWAVERPDLARPVEVSSRRLSSIVDPLALALCAALAIGGAGAVLVRRARVTVRGVPLYRQEHP